MRLFGPLKLLLPGAAAVVASVLVVASRGVSDPVVRAQIVDLDARPATEHVRAAADCVPGDAEDASLAELLIRLLRLDPSPLFGSGTACDDEGGS